MIFNILYDTRKEIRQIVEDNADYASTKMRSELIDIASQIPKQDGLKKLRAAENDSREAFESAAATLALIAPLRAIMQYDSLVTLFFFAKMCLYMHGSENNEEAQEDELIKLLSYVTSYYLVSDVSGVMDPPISDELLAMNPSNRPQSKE